MPTIKVASVKIHTEDLDALCLEKVSRLNDLKIKLRDLKIEIAIMKEAQNRYAGSLYNSINQTQK